MTLDKSSPMSKRYGRSVTKYDVSSKYCDDMYPTEEHIGILTVT